MAESATVLPKRGLMRIRRQAMASEGLSKPRKGKGRENISCWGCGKKGHCSHECKELKKSDKKAKDEGKALQGTSASAVEPDLKCVGAWAAKISDT